MHAKSYLKDGVPTLNPEDILLYPDYQIVDVRTAEEFTGELGHIKEAQLVTLGPDLETFISKMDKKKPLVFVCRSGARSGRATMAAQQSGFTEVYNMDGGMIKWNSMGLPIIK